MKHIRVAIGSVKTLFPLILVGLFLGMVPDSVAEPPPGPAAVGKPVPNFSLTLFSGKKFELKDFRGGVLVLNFWASW